MKISKTFLYMVDGRIDDVFDPEEATGSKRYYRTCEYDPANKSLKVIGFTCCDDDGELEIWHQENATMDDFQKYVDKYQSIENEELYSQVHGWGVAEPWLYK